MNAEIIAIVTVGVALAGVILASARAAGHGAVGIAAGWENRCVGVQDEYPAWGTP